MLRFLWFHLLRDRDGGLMTTLKKEKGFSKI